MTRQTTILLSTLSLLIGLCGCVSIPFARLKAVSTRPIQVTNVDLSRVPRKENVDGGYNPKFFAIGVQMDEAVERTLNAGGGNLIIDATIYGDVWFLPPLTVGYRVVGTVLNVPQTETPAVNKSN